MSFSSKVIYEGDGIQTDYTVTFPYISTTHVKVYIDEVLQLLAMNYVFTNSSTIQFTSPPGDGSAIEIKRSTSPTSVLVDFEDGSTLRATDLDTAYLHNYYLSQEYADSFNDIINNALTAVATGAGIVETETDAVIAALVNEMLETSAAANLQARITDIDANAEAIITLGSGLQTQINTLAQGVAANVYVQAAEPVPGVGGIPDPIAEGSRWYDSDDNNKPYIYLSLAWVSIEDPRIGDADTYINLLQTEYGESASLFIAEVASISNEAGANTSALTLLGAENIGGTAFVLNLDTTYVGAAESLANRFTSIQSSYESYADAAVTVETIARTSADGAIAASVTSLTSTVDGNTANITTAQASIDGIEAEYAVDLDVNGYVTGFRIINGGTPGASAFVIRSDKFVIVDTTGDTLTEYVPFEISGGKINMRGDVKIDGSLMVNGTLIGSALEPGTIGTTQIGPNAITTTQLNAEAVTAGKIAANAITATEINATNLSGIFADLGTITAGNITLDESGYIKGGQTAYNTGSGFFLGYDGANYKFSIGDGTSNYLIWDGTDLTIRGDLNVGVYELSDNIILSATTERTDSGPDGGYQTYKTFTIDKDGAVRVTVEYKCGTFTGGVITPCNWRVTVNSVLDTTWGSSAQTTYTTRTIDLTGLSAGDVIDIDMIGGKRDPVEEQDVLAYIRNAYVKADVVINPGGTVNLD